MQKINKEILRFFSSLADETRLNIVLHLAKGPKTVSQIHEYLGKNKITLSGVSHQLTHLSNLDILSYHKKGRHKFFELSNNFCWCILKDAYSHYGKTKCKTCVQLKNGQ